MPKLKSMIALNLQIVGSISNITKLKKFMKSKLLYWEKIF